MASQPLAEIQSPVDTQEKSNKGLCLLSSYYVQAGS